MVLEVINDKSILVIEPDLNSRIKIKAIFDFIEYGSITFADSIEEFADSIEENQLKEDPYFIVVNKYENEAEMLKQVEAIHEKYKQQIPVLVFSSTLLPESIESLITDTLEFPPTLKNLRIALQNVKMFYLERSLVRRCYFVA